MAVTVASFRADFPQEFGSKSAYPDQAISYWLAIAAIMLGTGAGSPPQVCAFTGSVEGSILTVSAIDFGSLSLLPLILQGEGLPPSAAILSQLTGTPNGVGTYKLGVTETIEAETMVALSGVSTRGSNPYWGAASSLASSPPTTMADFATELWVAHQLVLEKQAVAAAMTGGNPGTTIGVVTSKSVGGVSVSYDTQLVSELNGGYYNQTLYGQRFIRLARIRGSGPIQLGIGRAPPFLFFNSWGLTGSYNAWAGPYPGIEQGDTGFSS